MSHPYVWLRSRFGIVLPNVSKDYIESFFKWVSYNAAVAIVMRAGATLAGQHKWLLLVPVLALTMVFLDLINAYARSQLVAPLLDAEHAVKNSKVGGWMVLMVILVLQFTLWKILGALAASQAR